MVLQVIKQADRGVDRFRDEINRKRVQRQGCIASPQNSNAQDHTYSRSSGDEQALDLESLEVARSVARQNQQAANEIESLPHHQQQDCQSEIAGEVNVLQLEFFSGRRTDQGYDQKQNSDRCECSPSKVVAVRNEQLVPFKGDERKGSNPTDTKHDGKSCQFWRWPWLKPQQFACGVANEKSRIDSRHDQKRSMDSGIGQGRKCWSIRLNKQHQYPVKQRPESKKRYMIDFDARHSVKEWPYLKCHTRYFAVYDTLPTDH